MAILKLFKSSITSCKYYTRAGKELNFVAGRYATDNPTEIDELEAEIAAGHPHIYVDTNETEVDSVRIDPLEAIRKKAIADYLAEQEAKVGQDTGTTDASAGEGAGMTTSASASLANMKAASNSK